MAYLSADPASRALRERDVYTVSRLNREARGLIEGGLGSIWLEGEISNFARPGSGTVVGGVVVAPRASELIHTVALAVDSRITVDQLAHSFTIYPSISGSVAEAARQLHTQVWRD